MKVNAKVVRYDLKAPTPEQCENYLESHKITDGKYKLDNAVYTKPEAIEWIKENIRIELAIIKVATSIDENSGFRVKLSF